MPVSLLKEKPTQPAKFERYHKEARSTTSPTNVIDLVAWLQQSLAKARAERKPKVVTESAVEELSRKLAALFGQKRVRPQQSFYVELIWDGKKVRIKRADAIAPEQQRSKVNQSRETFDPAKAGSEAVETAKAAESGAWTGAELEEQFGLSAATLHRRRKEHRIVYWRDSKHEFHYPKWQFTESGALLPGVQEVLKTFRSPDEWRVMRYFLAPRHQLEDRTPLSLLQVGHKDDVIAHARSHAEENTW